MSKLVRDLKSTFFLIFTFYPHSTSRQLSMLHYLDLRRCGGGGALGIGGVSYRDTHEKMLYKRCVTGNKPTHGIRPIELHHQPDAKTTHFQRKTQHLPVSISCGALIIFFSLLEPQMNGEIYRAAEIRRMNARMYTNAANPRNKFKFAKITYAI